MDFSSIKKVIIELTKRNYKSLLAMSFIIFVMTTFAVTSDLLLSGSFILLFFILSGVGSPTPAVRSLQELTLNASSPQRSFVP